MAITGSVARAGEQSGTFYMKNESGMVVRFSIAYKDETGNWRNQELKMLAAGMSEQFTIAKKSTEPILKCIAAGLVKSNVPGTVNGVMQVFPVSGKEYVIKGTIFKAWYEVRNKK